MSQRFILRPFTSRLFCIILAGVLVLGGVYQFVFSPAYGAQLGNRQLQISSSYAGDTATYQLSFTLSSPGQLGSIAIDFCSNDSVIEDPCTAPVGFSDSNAVLSTQTGQTNFSIDSSSTANKLILTRSPTAVISGPVSYTFSNITNPTSSGSYFVRLQTYASSDASGNSSDYGGLAFAIVNNVSINAEVAPYLIFCTGLTIPTYNCANASGDYINFGELSSDLTSQGSSQMLATTNAQSGYSISVGGTTLESGNNVVSPLSNNDVSRPGTSQFGLNLRANSSPSVGADPSGPGTGEPTTNYNQPNFYRFAPDESVASSQTPDDVREYTVSYILNVPPTQAPGVYVTTLTYICLANF